MHLFRDTLATLCLETIPASLKVTKEFIIEYNDQFLIIIIIY